MNINMSAAYIKALVGNGLDLQNNTSERKPMERPMQRREMRQSRRPSHNHCQIVLHSL